MLSNKIFPLVVLSSIVAAIVGIGLSQQGIYTPRASGNKFEGIHSDGWIEKDAAISFANLAPWGNRVTLRFDPWRPAGVAPAMLRFRVCGDLVGQASVQSLDQQITLSLEGKCEPRRLEIEGLNPFTPPNEKDSRELTVKLARADVGMFSMLPLGNIELIAATAAAVSMLTFLLVGLLRPYGRAQWAAFLVPVVSASILSTQDSGSYANSLYLWICFAALGVGALIGSQQNLSTEVRSGTGGVSVLLLVLILGAGLRFYGIDFGLPSNFHPDEVPKVNAIMRMYDSGTLNPQYFLHPTLLLYCSYGVNLVFHNVFGFEGPFRDSAFLAGRTVSAIAGTLSIPLLFLIAKRLYGTVPALLSSLCLALFPLHVTCSRYLKEDALLLFNVLLACAIMIESVYRKKPAMLLLAGFIAGVAASSKYSGMLTAAIVLSAPWLASSSFVPDRRYLFWAVIGVLCMPLGFVICTPYSLITPDVFLRDFRSEQNHMAKGHTIAVDAWSQLWMFHYSKSVVPGMTWIPAILGSIGVGYLLAQRRIKDLFVVAVVLLFYLPAEWVKAKPAPQPERYILPCLPFMAIAFSAMISNFRWRTASVILAIGVVLLPALRSFELTSEITDDTRDRMALWVRENVAPGSKLLVDYKRYSPEFKPNEYDVEYMLQARIIPRLDIKALKTSGKDYLILSSLFYERYFSQPGESAAVRQRIREVFSRVPIVTQMRPKFGTYGFHNPTVTLFSLRAEDFERLENELRLKDQGKLAMTLNERLGGLGVAR